MNKKILVTGATGGVGSHLIRILSETGIDFIAGVRNPEKLAEDIETVTFDYTDSNSMRGAMLGIHSLFLLQPFLPGMHERQIKAVEIAKEAGVKHIVRLSVALSDPNSDCLMARIYGEVDAAVKDSGIDYTILEPATFMQNFVTYSSQSIREENAFYLPVGKGRTGFIDSRDVATVAARVLMNPEDHRKKTYYLTGSEALSYSDAAAIISAAIGREVTYIDQAEDLRVKAFQKMGIPREMIDQAMSLYRVIKRNKPVKYSSYVSPTVKEITGKDPETFAEFTREFAAVWR